MIGFWGVCLALVALSVAYLAMLYTSYRKSADLREYLPSFAWWLLMVVPFGYQASFFATHHAMDAFYFQALGVGVFFVSFAGFDHYSLRRPLSTLREPLALKTSVPYVVMLISFCVWGLHIYQMPQIPLVEKLLHPYASKEALDMMRERSSKLLDMPLWFIYLCQILLLVSPVQIVYFFRKRQALFGALSLFVVLIYSRITLAKGPLYLIALTFIIVYLPTLLKFIQAKRLQILAAPIAMVVVYVLFWDSTSPIFGKIESQERVQELKTLAQQSRLTYTPADRYRIFLREKIYNEAPRWRTAIADFYYRAFLVPSEVSSRWYNYYPELNDGKWLGVYGLTPSSRDLPGFQHPATTVGVWAYYERFPMQYLKTIRAYCSVDCDAYVRWGVPGLVFVAVFAGFCRWLLACLRSGNEYFDQYYIVGLTTFSMSTLAASIQAIFVAQGFVVFALALLVGVGFSRYRQKIQMI